ncbi:cullin-3-like [Rhipicephalus sanguineus]|uniref:cullin-3-like n=1 Tax=Rhipicephalus sanguineus TaxID=34632 RepID=UPI001893D278|nr:cullin-3-like [Rhipicephalus sanguineus]
MERHINEESERAMQCLDESNEVPILQVIEKELIWKHMKAIVDMEDSGVEHMLKNQMIDELTRLFRFLKRVPGGVKTLLDCEKYLFERYYKQHLSKRLLLNKSASDEVERTMVAKLRNECDCLFTYKMEAMFKDMNTSCNMMHQFKEAVSSCRVDLHGVDINLRVLTTGFWPLAAVTQQTTSRLGRSERSSDLPVLIKTPASNEIESDPIFTVNEAFTSNLQKVKIELTSSKKNTAPQENEPAVNLDEDRRYELEAAIIRVMKARKTLSHEDLLAEMTKLLQTRYTPSPAAFRKRDALVEREYLEKAGENTEVYNYVP